MASGDMVSEKELNFYFDFFDLSGLECGHYG